MSEQPPLTVNAPVVQPGAGGTPSYGSYNPGGATGVATAQALAMQIFSMMNGSGFDPARGLRFVKANNLTDLLGWIKDMVFLDNSITDPKISYSGPESYLARTALYKNWQLNMMNDQLSGKAYSVVDALANFFWGNGRPMNVDINNIGLQLTPQKIVGFNDKLMSMSAPGSYNFSHKFAYDTGNDSVVSNFYLGNITLQLDGTLTRQPSGEWTLNGHVRGYQDKYDFGPATHRTQTNEDITTIGRFLGEHFSGVEYPININGQLNNIKFTGH